MSKELEMTSKNIDTLVAIVENGPLWDGDVPSKRERDDLIEAGYAVRVLNKGEDGHTAATYKGAQAYKDYFGNADTIKEAKANRIAKRTIRKAKAVA